MNRIKQFTGKKRTCFEWILFGIVCGQIIAIILINFLRAKYTMDYDSICALTQAVEIWKQKTLFLTDWTYQTTLGWDSAVPAAALFYGLTHNIFTAYGIANCLTIILYLYVIHRICKDLEMSRVTEYVILILVFGPYTWDQLGYAKMMFTAAGYYSIKTIMALMAVSIMIRFHKTTQKQIMFVMLFEVFLFASSISTTVYELICCVGPVILYQIIEIACENKLFENGRWHGKCLMKRQYLFSVVSVGAAGAGILLCKVLALPNNPPAMKLTTTVNLAHNAAASVSAIFALFGGSSSAETEVLSVNGIYTVACFVLVALMLGSFVYCVIRMLRNKRLEVVTGLVLCFVIVNMAVLILADMTYSGGAFENRYHLLPMMAVILCSGLTADQLRKIKNDTVKVLVSLILVTMILYINVTGYRTYSSIDNSADELTEILDDAKENGIDILYVFGDDNIEEARIMKSLSEEVQIISTSDGQTAAKNGSTTRYFDAGAVQNMHAAVLTTKAAEEKMPAWMWKENTLIKKYAYRDYELYDLIQNKFDFKVGLPDKGKEVSIDYPYSWGYVVPKEKINEEGALVLDGTQPSGIVQSGPYSEVTAGTYTITFDYEIEDGTTSELPVFDVALNDGKKVCAKVKAERGENKALIRNLTIKKGKNIQFRLYVPQGVKMKYYKMTVQREK